MIRSTNLLFPVFRDRLLAGLKVAHAEGLQVHPFETYRSIKRQAELYAQGRTAPGKIVTYARPGESWHHYGLAADVVFDGNPKPGIQWSWDGGWKRLAEIMKAAGLESVPGDMPHWQLTGGLSVAVAERIMEQDGLMAVWLEVERRLGGVMGHTII